MSEVEEVDWPVNLCTLSFYLIPWMGVYDTWKVSYESDFDETSTSRP